MTNATSFIERLEGAGLRVTDQRRAVAALIAVHPGHFTEAELEREVQRSGSRIGRATLFRALELFAQLGVVERLDLPSGEHAYVRCEPSHHHHVICLRCGRTVEVEGCGMPELIREVAARTGFQVERHRLELYGICPTCREEIA